MANKKKSSILTLPLFLVTVPITILSLIFSVVAPRNIYIGTVESSKEELNNICLVAHLEYDERGFSYALRNKINDINFVTGIELTVFKGEEQFITTTTWGDSNSSSFIADPAIVGEVISKQENVFVADILFEEHSFCAFYMPIIESGNAIGVIFAAKNVDEVNAQMRRMIALIIGGSWTTILLIGAIAFITFGKMRKDLKSTVTYLSDISEGKLDIDINERLINRYDEIGDVGKSAKTMKESIESLINYDSLTGLVNRRACQECLNKASENSPETLYVALGDLDKFKTINDTYGHGAGDEVLRRVSEVFAELMNGKGVASRWGGEEFLFVFTKSQEQEIEDLLNEIIARVRTLSFEHDGKTFSTTISIGLSRYSTSIDKLILDADRNMYKAKAKGGNKLIK